METNHTSQFQITKKRFTQNKILMTHLSVQNKDNAM